MLREMRLKLSSEIEQLSHELNVVIPQAIAHAVELGDLRENSEYKAALERQQFVQARHAAEVIPPPPRRIAAGGRPAPAWPRWQDGRSPPATGRHA